MGKTVAATVAAPPKTPKAPEPAVVADDVSIMDASDAALLDTVEESDAVDGLLTSTQLRTFAETPTASERLAVLSTALRVDHYEANPRSFVWINFCFGVLTFALEEAQFSESKTLALLRVANEVFTFATSPLFVDEINDAVNTTNKKQLPAFPSTEATYDDFRQLVRANSIAGSSTETSSRTESPLWDASDVAQIVAFMSSTFFRHVAAYQYVFQFPRTSRAREVALVVESPMPPLPLADATATPALVQE